VIIGPNAEQYSWYRFVDQPSFQQYRWSAEKKARLQTLIEQIHRTWTVDRNYMAPPATGALVALDPALLVTPPPGLEVGYVPIVTRQEAAVAELSRGPRSSRKDAKRQRRGP